MLNNQKVTPCFSVIIPAYCMERYLDRCLESLVAQTYVDFEIVLIDDGSIDTTPKICEDWARKDSRIRVFHTENKGLSAARNEGFRQACGDWVIFVDADDELEPNALRCFSEVIDSTGKDRWKRQTKDRPDKTCQDSKNNRVAGNSF